MINRLFFRGLFLFSKNPKKKVVAVDPQYYKQVHSQKLKQECGSLLPSSQKRNILVTSALPYVNNKPHLGNIVGAVLSADVFARYGRLMGHNTLYICGTDEYGTASEVKALKEKKTPKQICDQFHEIHKQIYQWFDIAFDHFGRTSKPVHSQKVQKIFKEIHEKGIISQKSSIQWHCGTCDLFLADRFIQGLCKNCGAKTRGDQCEVCNTIFNDVTTEIDQVECSICRSSPKLKQTVHLYLNLTQQMQGLRQWLIQGDKMDLWSKNAKGITKGWLFGKTQDRCITRDLKWGVGVPLQGFEQKVFYVWFEAPIGYISMTADLLGQNYTKWWQKQKDFDVELHQFMGKDNVVFHSILCPMILRGTKDNWTLPTHISATQHLMYEGGKFSKSQNIGIFGDQCIETGISSDYWRYYLLRVRPEYFDCEFDWDDFAQKSNKELLNSIGNLIHRVLKFSHKKYGTKMLPFEEKDLTQDQLKVISQLQEKYKRYNSAMEKMLLSQGLTAILEISHLINQYVGKIQFWKHPQQVQKLGFLMRAIKVMSTMMAPFVPSLAAKVNFLLGCDTKIHSGSLHELKDMKSYILNCLKGVEELREPIPLIEQITEEKISEFRKKYGSHKQTSQLKS